MLGTDRQTPTVEEGSGGRGCAHEAQGRMQGVTTAIAHAAELISTQKGPECGFCFFQKRLYQLSGSADTLSFP